MSNGHTGYSTFNELLEDLFYKNKHVANTHFQPQANIYESNTEYRIELAVPGLDKKLVKLTVDNDLLKLSANQSADVTDKKSFTRQEFDYSTFERSFIIPENVDRESISAAYHNGLLTVVLPIKDEHINKGPKEIDIK